MSEPVIRDVRISLIEAPLSDPIVAPFGTVTVRRKLASVFEPDHRIRGTEPADGISTSGTSNCVRKTSLRTGATP